ncbi:hypothetical protein ACIBAH_01010 [Streptomyces sp. NPDC051445]|uniref:hypothetical protein n=1 Tax=Streptomyces sp. NPDC051445 TaxID=3365653 RepID=UPI00378799B5
MIGTVFFGHADHGLTQTLDTAMPGVTGGFVLCAGLCALLPHTATSDPSAT